MKRNVVVMFIGIVGIVGNIVPIHAQDDGTCGVIDELVYPVESVVSETIAEGYDDFGIYRGRWGGNHVAIDVAFREQGSPIQSMARGLVTYSDIEGWDTERGVVIISHNFPDGNRFYSLYGHVEETDVWRLPSVGSCVEAGQIIAAVGWPSSSAPHLHFEIRDFLPDDGGPGYIEGNPLESGWYHPLNFIQLWQLRMLPAFIDFTTFKQAPTLPPVELVDGLVAAVSDANLFVSLPDGGGTVWSIGLDAIASGMVALSDGRIVARSRSGQTVVVANGRFQALWRVDGPDIPFVQLDDTLIFAAPDGGMIAYNAMGELLWDVQLPDGGQVVELSASGETAAYVIKTDDGTVFRMVDGAGAVINEMAFDTSNVLVASVLDGSRVVLADNQLIRFLPDGTMRLIRDDVRVRGLARTTAQLTADVGGHVYLYTGDSDDTLLSWDDEGELRWETTLPFLSSQFLKPLLGVDNGCLLYSLDTDGQLNVFNAQTGDLVTQVGIYAGGDRTGRPSARLLTVRANGEVSLGAGFLSLVTLDGHLLGESAFNTCLLG